MNKIDTIFIYLKVYLSIALLTLLCATEAIIGDTTESSRKKRRTVTWPDFAFSHAHPYNTPNTTSTTAASDTTGNQTSPHISCPLVVANCGRKKRRCQDCVYTITPPRNTPITIYIHGGGQPIFSLFIPSALFTYCPRGLTAASKLSSIYTLSNLIGTLSVADPQNFPAEGIYTFGWSGLLSHSQRQHAGLSLYHTLRALQNDPDYADTPITIITHSHGGNVALNIARAAAEYGDTTLKIDKLILTACPVQKETAPYINSPIFKKTYAFYSQSDLIQILDPQGVFGLLVPTFYTSRIFSSRYFHSAPELIQAEIKFNNRATPGHLGFLTSKFLYNLPEILRILESDSLRSSSPVDEESKAYCLSINGRGTKSRVEPCRSRTRRSCMCNKTRNNICNKLYSKSNK
jgi:hypothetical protein